MWLVSALIKQIVYGTAEEWWIKAHTGNEGSCSISRLRINFREYQLFPPRVLFHCNIASQTNLKKIYNKKSTLHTIMKTGTHNQIGQLCFQSMLNCAILLPVSWLLEWHSRDQASAKAQSNMLHRACHPL